MTKARINFTNETIEITKTEAKAASIYGSDAFRELQEVRKDFPNFKIVVKESKKNGRTYKGMTLEFMKKYIEEHENAKEHLSKLKTMKEKKVPYGEIKKWFLAQYPIIKESKSRINWYIAA